MHNFKELHIWQRSRELVKVIYQLTGEFPNSEHFGLISQMRRSAISIPSNIAEGSRKSSNKDFIRFLEISHSSSFELETQLILSNDLGFITESELKNVLVILEEIQKMIFGFIQKLKASEVRS
ncbi:four helix bundle protein [bacterium]|nr:four helix bundle protein [bacterium]MBU1063495.1 four helix bundle protein [bacterium]MBU1635379.1 four helix bundle protein [bacterium]MBU1873660.1 four helix bundle protein [bacterium]